MYEIAEPASHTPFATVEPATRFTEVCDGGKLAVDGSSGVPARVQGVAGLLCGIFVFEAGVDVADEVCVQGHQVFISIFLPRSQILQRP